MRIPHRGNRSRDDAERSPVHVFATLPRAGDFPERLNGQLQTEVARLSGELGRASSAMTCRLDENISGRYFLAQIFDILDGQEKSLLAGTPQNISLLKRLDRNGEGPKEALRRGPSSE